MIVDSKAAEVQIYRNSVSVARTGSVTLPAGRSTVFVKGMSQSARSDSFMIKFPGAVHAANIQIVSIEEAGEGTPESERIAKQISEVNSRMETYTMMMELRKKNADFSVRKGVSAADQEKYLDELPEKLFELQRKIDELGEKKSELSEKLSKAEEEEEKPLIMAELDCDEDGTYPFILRYQDSADGWEPKYEVHFTGEGNPLEVYMKAVIRQYSKEDWKQVGVTLYTGNPSVPQNIPKLPCVQLSIREPVAARTRYSASMAVGSSAAETAEDSAVAGMSQFMGMSMNAGMNRMMTPEAGV